MRMQRWQRGTLAIILALRELGYSVLLPCCSFFRTASSYYRRPHPKMATKHYHGQVDFFGVYCRETGAVYLVPVDHLDVDRHASLRRSALSQ
jgi:hypothetical protein